MSAMSAVDSDEGWTIVTRNKQHKTISVSQRSLSDLSGSRRSRGSFGSNDLRDSRRSRGSRRSSGSRRSQRSNSPQTTHTSNASNASNASNTSNTSIAQKSYYEIDNYDIGYKFMSDDFGGKPVNWKRNFSGDYLPYDDYYAAAHEFVNNWVNEESESFILSVLNAHRISITISKNLCLVNIYQYDTGKRYRFYNHDSVEMRIKDRHYLCELITNINREFDEHYNMSA